MDLPPLLLAGEGVPGFERYFSGTPSPPLPRLYADNPDRGRAANCRGRGKNLEFAMELLLRERLLAPFARVVGSQPRPALSIFTNGTRRRRVASGASQFAHFTMISRVDLRIARTFEGARYFGDAAAGATRLRSPPVPQPHATPLTRYRVDPCCPSHCRDGPYVHDHRAMSEAVNSGVVSCPYHAQGPYPSGPSAVRS